LASTTNLGLTTYDTASGSAITFLSYRLSQGGNTGNMLAIDNFAGETSASLIALKSGIIFDINATQISTNYFEGTNSAVTGYNTNLKINLKTNATNSGSASLNINSYGTKSLMKIDNSGTIINLINGDILANKYNQFIYNGTYFIVMNGTISGSSTSSGSATFATSGSVTDRHLVIYDGASGSQVRDGFASVDASGNLSLSGKQIQNYTEKAVTSSGSVTYNIDWSTGNLFEVTMTGNKTITFSNLSAGRSITTMMIQDVTGSRIVSWPTVKWTAGSAMILSTASNARDVVSFMVDSSGSTVYGFPAGMDMK
jgi:hypothetical protein